MSGLLFPRELPPTAGLPLLWADWLTACQTAWRNVGRAATPSLPEAIGHWLHLPVTPLTACSGTAALTVILTALAARAPERTEIIVPAYTCPLVAHAVFAVERPASCPPLRVVACDVAPGRPDFDLEALGAACSERTLAVVPTHLAGLVTNVAAVSAVAEACGAFVIEDAAQALGARVGEASVGLAGHAAFFSLAVGKGLTTYEGGLFFSRDADLHEHLAQTAARCLPNRPWLTARRVLELLATTFFYRPDRLWPVYGRPLRAALREGDPIRAVGDDFDPHISLHSLDGLRQRVAANAFARLPAFLEAGRKQAVERGPRLAALGLDVLGDAPGVALAVGVRPQLMLRLPNKAARDRALARLWTSGLGVTRLFAHALPDYPALAGRVQGPCPNARALADELLTLSNTPWLDEPDVDAVLTALKGALA